MKKKFERIKDRQQFFKDVGTKFGYNPENIRVNWFNKLFFRIPKSIDLIDLESFIDNYISMEKEDFENKKVLRKKYLEL